VLLDLSVTGARVRVPSRVDPGVGELWLDLALPAGRVELQVDLRRTVVVDGQAEIGMEFLPGQETALAAMAVGVFHADVPQPTQRRSGGREPGLNWDSAVA
jgi:hypothetical protein